MKAILCLSLLVLAGCRTPPDSVITATATTLGVEVAQNPATQLYHAKMGYARAEMAYVPTDRGQPNTVDGAKNSVDVILELKLNNIFTGGGVYQRLAIGSTACSQAGAALMFSRDADGKASASTSEVLKENLPLLLQRSAQ